MSVRSKINSSLNLQIAKEATIVPTKVLVRELCSFKLDEVTKYLDIIKGRSEAINLKLLCNDDIGVMDKLRKIYEVFPKSMRRYGNVFESQTEKILQQFLCDVLCSCSEKLAFGFSIQTSSMVEGVELFPFASIEHDMLIISKSLIEKDHTGLSLLLVVEIKRTKDGYNASRFEEDLYCSIGTALQNLHVRAAAFGFKHAKSLFGVGCPEGFLFGELSFDDSKLVQLKWLSKFSELTQILVGLANLDFFQENAVDVPIGHVGSVLNKRFTIENAWKGVCEYFATILTYDRLRHYGYNYGKPEFLLVPNNVGTNSIIVQRNFLHEASVDSVEDLSGKLRDVNLVQAWEEKKIIIAEGVEVDVGFETMRIRPTKLSTEVSSHRCRTLVGELGSLGTFISSTGSRRSYRNRNRQKSRGLSAPASTIHERLRSRSRSSKESFGTRRSSSCER
eukprot:TRINITY_DN805_c0_g7_i1.p1 TRINITY_DN805_c0_g7~~TRINITY_DN805_c0_g7_i1.p1  ORF type:complete len:448 (+),score=83.31 TRINITY_DN805_c0_g7_i1:133-1476(+)